MTKQNWIGEAIDAATEENGKIMTPTGIVDATLVTKEKLSAELHSRVPVAQLDKAMRRIVSEAVEAFRTAGWDGPLMTPEAIGDLVKVIVDDSEVVQVAEWYHATTRVLDDAEVPHTAPEGSPTSAGRPMDVAARVGWVIWNRDWYKNSRDSAITDRDAFIATGRDMAEQLRLRALEVDALVARIGDVTKDRDFWKASREAEYKELVLARKDVEFYRKQAETAAEELKDLQDLVRDKRELDETERGMLEAKIRDRDGLIEALEVAEATETSARTERPHPAPKKLGSVQKDVLAGLRVHGSWRRNCGWVWDNVSNTTRILNSLVRAGHVVVRDGVYTPKETS